MRQLHYTARFTALLVMAIACSGLLMQPRVLRADTEDVMVHAKALSKAFRQAAEASAPAVVTIVAKQKVSMAERNQQLRNLLNDPNFRRMFPEGRLPFDLPESEEQEGDDSESPGFTTNVGSGVVISDKGIILTNSHVVEQADEVVVRMSDGTEVSAKDIRRDSMSDVATLRIEPSEGLPVARIGNSDQLEIGDWVIAIGSPFELEATVSAGIISAKERGIRKIERARLLQTDAAINPGNSGGPLVNLSGEVVGINTAIATNSGGYQGVGFAIPINQAKWIADELLQHGRVRRAWLGTSIGELDAEAARKLDLKARSGIRVVSVFPKSPADKAGLKNDDVIVEFAGIRVRSPGDLQSAVEQQPIGSARKMAVLRGKDRVEVDVTLEALPERGNPGPQD
jgi:serine protease Do